ncbi:DUF4437 domain-containing protein [Sphingomonas sp. RB3P16]|uniref:DUF4437 domain-containing protein n=1 Tax=Parasphingomonas frigoris TaxID=3096163 RepID=UPI002FC83FB9
MRTLRIEAQVEYPNTSWPHRARLPLSRIILLGATVSLIAVTSSASSFPATRASENIPVERLHFYQSKEGLTFAKAWGDPAAGPHSNYIMLPGSYASPLHVHTSDYYGVVVSGVVTNERRAQPDRPLRPGSYWFQRGGEPHTTKCLSREECLIFVTSHGSFDIRVVPDPAPAGQTPARKP